MDTELTRIYETLTQAVCPEDVFGILDAAADEEALDRVFRQMARICHPDRYSGDGDVREIAQEAFQKLNEMRDRASAKIGRGTYGQRGASSEPESTYSTSEIQTPKHVYRVSTTPLAEGDLTYVYKGTVAGGEGDAARIVVKVAKDAADNDLVRNEIRVLGRLWHEPGSGNKHLPILIDQFKTDGKQALVLREIDAFDLTTIKEKYPDGLPAEHVCWILQRLLSVLGFAHHRGILHTNVEPSHIMVRPKDHNVFLIDWSYGVVDPARSREGFRTLNEVYSPPEVEERKPPAPASDLYSAAKSMVYLLGDGAEPGEIPPGVAPRLFRYLQFLLLPNQRMRAQDAWEMHRELALVREEVFGPKRFLELRV